MEDREFDSIYPKHVKRLADIHFTPIAVAKVASRFLVDKLGVRVLDIGSGAGKFCMVGSVCAEGHFTGVEIRESLFALSNHLSGKYRLSNTEFIHSNIMEIEFKSFNAFYFFNSFYENIAPLARIDNTVELNRKLYSKYSLYVKSQLESMPVGTRLVTYFSYLDEIPEGYKIQRKSSFEKLLMWQKIS